MHMMTLYHPNEIHSSFSSKVDNPLTVCVCDPQFEGSAEKDDLMGTEDVAKKGFFSKATFKNRSTIFTLGNRDTVLTTELEDPIIVIPQAQRAERKVWEGVTC